MKKFFFLLFVCFNVFAFAKEYKVGSFIFDFEDGWNETKGKDPNSVLKIEKGDSYIEFIKIDDELSDFYLNSRINEQREVLVNKGIKPSDIKTQTIHSVSKIYYFSYDDKKNNILGLFTYQSNTYNFLSYGVSDETFKKLIFTFRNVGEKIEIAIVKPKPKPKPKIIAKKEGKTKEDNFSGVSYVSITESTSTQNTSQPVQTLIESTSSYEPKKEPKVSVSSLPAEQQKTMPNIQANLNESIKFISSTLDNIIKNSNSKPFLNRKPIDKYLILGLIIFYFILVLVFRHKFSKYSNPKIKPYPKEMPPDFLFPFIITKVETGPETMYQVITRNNQFLSAHFNHNYKKFLKYGVNPIIIIHIVWSLGEFVRTGFFSAIVLSIPLGRYIISLIEFPFLLLILYSLFLKYREKQKLYISDSQMNVLSEIVKLTDGFVVKDGKGREILKVKKTGGYFKREWNIINEDNQLIMTVKDDYPDIWLWTKLLGNTFLKQRCYYGMYVENQKRIGFLFLDPNSISGYQLHFDYDYFRLVNPLFLVSVFLYIISKEKEESILFI